MSPAPVPPDGENPYREGHPMEGVDERTYRLARCLAWDEGFAAGEAARTAEIVKWLRTTKGDEWMRGQDAARSVVSRFGGGEVVRRVSRWLALDRRSGRGAGLPTVEVVAAEDYDRVLREVNDLRDQVQMYEEKAERDWRDFGEMQDARIAADDRVVELEKELARVCKQLDSANDMVERAWSLTAGAMSGNPHRPTANTEWMDAAHAWAHDYCMSQGTLGGES